MATPPNPAQSFDDVDGSDTWWMPTSLHESVLGSEEAAPGSLPRLTLIDTRGVGFAIYPWSR
jgi:hypothetical protein